MTMASPGTYPNPPRTLVRTLGVLLGTLLLVQQGAAQWPPQGGFWNPSSSSFFNNLNRGILPGGVRVESLGGFPGGTPGGTVIPGQGGAGRTREVDCDIEPAPGPCKDNKTRYYYDQRLNKCFTFVYGGCLGNPNNYPTEAICLQRCKIKPRPTRGPAANANPCTQAPDQGPCRQRLERVFFNSNTGRCESFTFGGCGGNRNNFRDMQTCLQVCTTAGSDQQGPPPDQQGPPPDQQGPPPDQQGPPPNQQGPGDVCGLPPAAGRCNDRLVRYFYDPDSGSCKSFVYSGCEGNDNNFENEQTCYSRCRPDPGRGGDQRGPDQRGPDQRAPDQRGPDPNQPDVNVCEQPPVRGRCRGNMVRFYFDTNAGICRDFTYGGCDGNGNNFERLEDCERECRPESPPTRESTDSDDRGQNICLQPPVTGRCKGKIVRFYFDPRNGACADFIYSGCDGNDNNFERIEDCERECLPAPPPDTNRPDDRPRRPDDRPGRPDDRRDRPDDRPDRPDDRPGRPDDRPNRPDDRSGRPDDRPGRPDDRPDNRPDRPDDRPNRPDDRPSRPDNRPNRPDDRPSRPDDRPSRPDDRPSRPDNRPNRPDDRPSRPDDRPNRPDDRLGRPDDRSDNRDKQSQEVDLCSLPPVRGPCRRNVPRFYFDSNAGECRDFNFGGCQGNENNFESLQACQQRCKPAPPPQDPSPRPDNRDDKTQDTDICNQPPVRGRCRAHMARFYFDSNSGECRDFVYGGCNGNSNNFETIEACQARCKPATTDQQSDDLCTLRPLVGPCRARLPRYHYDSQSGQCRRFDFGGCQGNANNFKDVAACEERCKPKTPAVTAAPARDDLCNLPSKTGPCRARLARFFYDKDQGQCRQFNYGGCGGNTNNFKDKKSCESKCKRSQDCMSPSDSGRCLAHIRRFFYNRQTAKCESFVYGGCQGNSNNYRTKQDCESACVPPEKRRERLIDCPAPAGVAACIDLCAADGDCGKGQKCCTNGCGRLCIKGP